MISDPFPFPQSLNRHVGSPHPGTALVEDDSLPEDSSKTLLQELSTLLSLFSELCILKLFSETGKNYSSHLHGDRHIFLQLNS